MARPVRVMLRFHFGPPMRQVASGDMDKATEIYKSWREIRLRWKEDPGIRFISYYSTAGRSLDGYSHHYLFEIDDVGKVQEMNEAIQLGQPGPFEMYSFEVVFGNTEQDGFWEP